MNHHNAFMEMFPLRLRQDMSRAKLAAKKSAIASNLNKEQTSVLINAELSKVVKSYKR